jgi:hypothetical protein
MAGRCSYGGALKEKLHRFDGVIKGRNGSLHEGCPKIVATPYLIE